MFRGTSEISIDSKGRFAIPTRYRPEITTKCGGNLICTVDIYDPCLLLYTQDEWAIVEAKLVKLPNLDKDARRILRTILGYAQECVLDQAGRILLPAVLREYANLNKNIMLVGMLNKFEIWDRDIRKIRAEEDQAILMEDSSDHEKSQQLQELSL